MQISPLLGFISDKHFHYFLKLHKLIVMRYKEKKTELVIDITGQVLWLIPILMSADMLLWSVFCGGTWQYFGNLYHRHKADDEYSLWRTNYLKVSSVILIILAFSGLVIFVLPEVLGEVLGSLAFTSLFICLLGGGILYFVYLAFNISQLVNLIRETKNEA